MIALNEQAQQLFQSTFDKPVDLIPNFVDRLEVRPDGQETRWTYIGRLTPEKGVLELLKSWPRDQTIDVYGAGPLESEVRQLASAKPGQITFHGLVKREALRTRLGSSLGLVVPSLWPEGLPTVALEALSVGTPLLVSNRVAAAGDLQAAGVAVTYSPDEAGSVNLGLGRVTAERSSLSLRAAQVYEERYSRAAWLASMTHLYDEVVAGG